MTEPVPPKPTHGSLPARIRAAMEYADLTWPELAVIFSVSQSTLRRDLTEDTRHARGLRRELAHVCHVPEWFVLKGFAEASASQAYREALRRLDELSRLEDEHAVAEGRRS